MVKKNKFVCDFIGIYGVPESRNTDSFRCFLAHFSYTLYEINFGYMCIGLLTIIILISIFGKIKENYRWFILNQAFWDLFYTYAYICDNSAYLITTDSTDVQCVFNFEQYGFYFYPSVEFFYQLRYTAPYPALALLSFTRFLCLYFMHFYKKLTQKRRIAYLILGFNLVILLLNVTSLFADFADERKSHLLVECEKRRRLQKLTPRYCDDENDYVHDFLFQFLSKMERILVFVNYAKSPFCLLVSLISAFMLILKISRQFSFQWKHNRHELISSIRISLVILLQSLISSFVFMIELINNLGMIFVALGFEWVDKPEKGCTNCLVFALPDWLEGYYGITSSPVSEAICQCRIFIESLIVLFIMTGYREAIIRFFKVVIHALKNPKQFYHSIKSSLIDSKVQPLH